MGLTHICTYIHTCTGDNKRGPSRPYIKQGTLVGVIVAPVLAAAGLLLGAGLFVFLRRRKQQQRKPDDLGQSVHNSNAARSPAEATAEIELKPYITVPKPSKSMEEPKKIGDNGTTTSFSQPTIPNRSMTANTGANRDMHAYTTSKTDMHVNSVVNRNMLAPANNGANGGTPANTANNLPSPTLKRTIGASVSVSASARANSSSSVSASSSVGNTVPEQIYVKDIQIKEKLGSGNFGEGLCFVLSLSLGCTNFTFAVYRGVWHGTTPVALKMLKNGQQVCERERSHMVKHRDRVTEDRISRSRVPETNVRRVDREICREKATKRTNDRETIFVSEILSFSYMNVV